MAETVPPDHDVAARDYQTLQELLLGPTAERLDSLQSQVVAERVDANRLSQLLPSAIRESSARDEDFASALAPTLSDAFQQSIRKDPQGLADSIAPIMGPAIRRSIAQAIRAMVQSFNTALEHSLSPRSLGWRWEAWRTGRPFAEVVLLKTLRYRTELVLLIDRTSGLLMQSVSATDEANADLISAMLSAMQDFMKDSLKHSSAAGSDLLTTSTAEFTFWVHHGAEAILGVAIRGTPPESLRDKLERTVEKIHRNHGRLLQQFQGDTQSLQVVRPYLEACLDTEYSGPAPADRWTWRQHLGWIVPCTCLMAGMVWGLLVWQQRSYERRVGEILDLPPTAQLHVDRGMVLIEGRARHDWLAQAQNRVERLSEIKGLDTRQLTISDGEWVKLQELLAAEPGVVVTKTERNGENYEVHALLDPDASDPARLVEQAGLKKSSVHWRLRTLEGLLAKKSPSKSEEEAPEVEATASVPPIVARTEKREVAPVSSGDRDRQLRQLIDAIGTQRIHFKLNTTHWIGPPQETVAAVARQVEQLQGVAASQGKVVGLWIDSFPAKEEVAIDVAILRHRAEMVGQRLSNDGLDRSIWDLQVHRMPDDGGTQIRFRVDLKTSGGPAPAPASR